MNLPRVWKVLQERNETDDLGAFNGSERGQANRIVGIHDQRVFDSKPHGQRPQDFLALDAFVENWTDDLHQAAAETSQAMTRLGGRSSECATSALSGGSGMVDNKRQGVECKGQNDTAKGNAEPISPAQKDVTREKQQA